jgi:hypothetical protein
MLNERFVHCQHATTCPESGGTRARGECLVERGKAGDRHRAVPARHGLEYRRRIRDQEVDVPDRLGAFVGRRIRCGLDEDHHRATGLVRFHHSVRLPNVLKAKHAGWFRLVTASGHLISDGLQRNVR